MLLFPMDTFTCIICLYDYENNDIGCVTSVARQSLRLYSLKVCKNCARGVRRMNRQIIVDHELRQIAIREEILEMIRRRYGYELF